MPRSRPTFSAGVGATFSATVTPCGVLAAVVLVAVDGVGVPAVADVLTVAVELGSGSEVGPGDVASPDDAGGADDTFPASSILGGELELPAAAGELGELPPGSLGAVVDVAGGAATLGSSGTIVTATAAAANPPIATVHRYAVVA